MKEVGATVEQDWRSDVLRFGDVSAQVIGPPSTRDDNAPSANNDSIHVADRYGEKTLC